jgi:hypothetical protein
MSPEERARLKALGIHVDEEPTADAHNVKAGPDLPPGVVLDQAPDEPPVNVVDLEDPSGRGLATTAAYPTWFPPAVSQALEAVYQGTGGLRGERRSEAVAAGIGEEMRRQPGTGYLSSPSPVEQDYQRRADAAIAASPGAGQLGRLVGSLPKIEALGAIVPGGRATSALGRVTEGAAGGGLLGTLAGARNLHDLSRTGLSSDRMNEAAATGAEFGVLGQGAGELLRGASRDVPAVLTRIMQNRRPTAALADILRARSLGAYQGDILAAEEAPAAAPRDFVPPDNTPLPPEATAVDERTRVRPRETMGEMVQGDQAHQEAMRQAQEAVNAEQAQAAGQRVQQEEAQAMQGGPTRVTTRENAARQAASDKLARQDQAGLPLELAPTNPGATIDPRRIGAELPRAEATGDPRIDSVNEAIRAERDAAIANNPPVEPLPRDFGRADMGYRTGPPRPEYTEPPPPSAPAQPMRYRYARPRSRLAQIMDEVRRSGIITEAGGDLGRVGELAAQRSAEGGKRMGEALRSLGREHLLSGEDVQRALASEPRLRTLAESPDVSEQSALRRPGEAILTELDRGGGGLAPGGYERLRNALSRMAGYGQRAAAGSMEAGPLSAAAGGARSALVRAADEALGEMGAVPGAHQSARASASLDEVADWAKTRDIREAANNTVSPQSTWLAATSKPAGLLWHFLRHRLHGIGADFAEAAVGIPAVQRTGLNPRFNASQVVDIVKAAAGHGARRGAVSGAQHYLRSERDSQYRRRVLGTR